MTRLAKSLLALLVLTLLAPFASAVWDSTTGNMPIYYPLCWGLSSTACIYGNTSGGNFVRIQTGGVDALTVNGSQAVGIPGALNVTGNTALTGNLAVTGTLAVTGASTFTTAPTFSYPIISTTSLLTTAYPTGQPIWVQENVLGALVTNAYNLGISTANAVGSCVYVAVSTSAIAKAGANCND